MPGKEKQVYLKSFGCQMNAYDSERILASLEARDYQRTDTPEAADLIVLNTCHIREKAAEKLYSDLGRLGAIKSANPSLKIAVAGCVAQAEGAEIPRRQPLVDYVVGPGSYHHLADLVEVETGKQPRIETEFPLEDKFDHLALPQKQMGPSAFLAIQEGCDKFCAFCVVPYTRGAERSREARKILDEARIMVDAGVREITLLGQNVNAYHGLDEAGREIGLGELIERIAKLDGLWRIRFTTSHPLDMDDALMRAFRDQPKLMPYLHLPIQSGSDQVLKAMNRRHSRDEYLRIIARLREYCPDIALSGDFIVGFPGEEEADFEDTLAIVGEAGFAHGYSFAYSPRPGTPAEARSQISDQIKAERLARLQRELKTAQQKFMNGFIGREFEVLFEKPGKLQGQIAGRSPSLFPAVANLDESHIGSLVRLRVEEVKGATFFCQRRG